jgi:hypothetical protein
VVPGKSSVKRKTIYFIEKIFEFLKIRQWNRKKQPAPGNKYLFIKLFPGFVHCFIKQLI